MNDKTLEELTALLQATNAERDALKDRARQLTAAIDAKLAERQAAIELGRLSPAVRDAIVRAEVVRAAAKAK